MDKLPKIAVTLTVAGAIAAYELAHPGVEHIEFKGQAGPAQPMGRVSIMSQVTLLHLPTLLIST